MNLLPNLEKVICENLNIPSQPITEKMLQKITVLKARYRFITNLSGLEHAVNLVELDLSENSIGDGNPLQNLINLKKIDLHSCNLKEINFLSNLKNLEWLNLRDNSIFRIEDLENLANLRHLFLSENVITDLSPLSNLKKLKTLHLGSYTDNPIGSLTAELYGNPYWKQIENINALSGLIQLEELCIWDHQLKDIKPLSNLIHLKELCLNGEVNQKDLKDLVPLESLPNLKAIHIENNAIEDLTPLVNNLKFGKNAKLYLRSNPLTDDVKKYQIPKLRNRGVHIFLR